MYAKANVVGNFEKGSGVTKEVLFLFEDDDWWLYTVQQALPQTMRYCTRSVALLHKQRDQREEKLFWYYAAFSE